MTAFLFALALILSLVENAIPPLPINFSGIKFGLSNIAVMYALFFISKKSAFSIAILKAAFVLSTRGVIAGFLSFCGGFFSIIIMILLMKIFKEKVSYLILSIFGAIFHNIGQFLGIYFIYNTFSVIAYLPVLIISGVIAGCFTALLLKLFLPALNNVNILLTKSSKKKEV